MVDLNGFKNWLFSNTEYSKETINDMVSRVKRADAILPWFDDIVYQFRLEQLEAYQFLSTSVRSQIKRALKLYFEYQEQQKSIETKGELLGREFKILSLFANIGVAEAYLEESGFHVAVANELLVRRAELYSQIYPQTKMICGDITTDAVFRTIIDESKKAGVNIIMATPPCQGMSTAGQQAEDDFRNTLICPVIRAIEEINPQYVFLENVPMQFNTYIKVEGRQVLIPDLVEERLGELYHIGKYVIDTKDYSVPQTRERAIMLLTKKDAGLQKWSLPDKGEKVVTMADAIGHLPKLDPYVTDVSEDELLRMFPHYYERKKQAVEISRWHNPPHHIKRQVVAMQHTPTGCTAFDNEIYYPVKEDGTPVRGYRNTYKRQNWDTAAYTVTMDNRKISSQNNVHPGRLEGYDANGDPLYSDARTLTLYEIMIIMSLPENWPVPKQTSEAFLRRIIGEGIPPLFVKKTFEEIRRNDHV